MSAHARQRRRRGLGLWMATALVVGNMIGSGVFLLPELAGRLRRRQHRRLAAHRRPGRCCWPWSSPGSAGPTRRPAGPTPTAAGVRRLRRLPDGLGLLDRHLGRQRGHRGRLRQLPGGLLGRAGHQRPAGGRGRGGRDLGAHRRQRPRGAPRRLGPGRDDRPQAGAAGGHRHRRAAVHRRRQLRPVQRRRRVECSAAVTAAAALTLWAFIGLESATVPAEDVADPERTIPRSTIIGTAGHRAGVHPGDGRGDGRHPGRRARRLQRPFADAAAEMFGGWAGDVVAIGAIVSAFGALNGWILLQGQIPMAAARDRLFPAAFAGPAAAARRCSAWSSPACW